MQGPHAALYGLSQLNAFRTRRPVNPGQRHETQVLGRTFSWHSGPLHAFGRRIWRLRVVYWIVAVAVSVTLFGFLYVFILLIQLLLTSPSSTTNDDDLICCIRLSIQAQNDRAESKNKWEKTSQDCKIVKVEDEDCPKVTTEQMVQFNVTNYNKNDPEESTIVVLTCAEFDVLKENEKFSFTKGELVKCYRSPIDSKILAFDEGPDEELIRTESRSAIIIIVLTVMTSAFMTMIILAGILSITARSTSNTSDRNYGVPWPGVQSRPALSTLLSPGQIKAAMTKYRVNANAHRSPGENGEEMCPICLDELFTQGKSPPGTENKDPATSHVEAKGPSESRAVDAVRLPCSHLFHSEGCISVWLDEGNRRCPVCAFDIVSSILDDPDIPDEESGAITEALDPEPGLEQEERVAQSPSSIARMFRIFTRRRNSSDPEHS